MAGIALRCQNLARATLSHARSIGARVVLGGIKRTWYHGAKVQILALAIVAEAAIVCGALPNQHVIY